MRKFPYLGSWVSEDAKGVSGRGYIASRNVGEGGEGGVYKKDSGLGEGEEY